MRLVGLLLLGLAVAATGTLLVALAMDLGGRHAQISLSWGAQTAVYAMFAWQVLLLSRVTSLRAETRRFWRTLLITGACTTVSYLTGAVRSLTTPGNKGAATAALNAGIGAFGCAVLVYACLTFRRDVRTASTQLRRWIDAVTTMVAALGALWYVEAGSLMRSGVSPASIVLAIVVEALALVTVLALLQPTGTNARPISMRGGGIGVVAIATAVIVEVLLPHSIDKSWLRVVLALRLITPALAAMAIWLERVRPIADRDRAPRTAPRYTRGPYTAVVLIYVLLALALSFGGAARTWGMFAAACIVTTLVVVRQSMAFSDNDALVRELRQAVLSASELTEQLHQHAFYDSLTELPNRALFGDTLRLALAGAGAGTSEGLVGVIVIDLDDFKLVNDRAGHAAGDAVLQEAAARLRGCVRTADTVARLGGDEFAVVLSGTDAGAVEAAAERIVAAFALPFVLADGDAFVGVSVGTALSSDSVPDGDTLLRYADIAMYEAKASGKRRHESFRAELLDQLMDRHNSREALLQAIGRDEIVVVYQPIIASA
ncbi:MAG: diguanylate cyclase, partial [Frankiaceae bacterium]|nr:diguanylate cyclase [Frankiaceae bacterium]